MGGQQISIDDLKKAEIEFTQVQFFPNEIKTLTSTTPEVNKKSPLYKLDPHVKDDLIRVGGRLNKAAIGEERKFPAIIPKNSHVSTLILRHVHKTTGHGGRNHMLSELREKYWIINANSAARKVLTKCVVCRKQRARVGEQKMSDLPQERLA